LYLEKFFDFVCSSYKELLKSTTNESFNVLTDLHKFFQKNKIAQRTIINLIFDKVLQSEDIKEILQKSKDQLKELIYLSWDAKYEPTFYVEIYTKLFKLLVANEELDILNDKKVVKHINTILKKESNVPPGFVTLVFFLNYTNFSQKINITDSELLNLLPKTDFTFENVLINSIIKSDLNGLKRVNSQDGYTHYRNQTNAILSNIALTIVYEKVSKIQDKELSFAQLKEKYAIDIEDLEEVMIDGLRNDLFDMIIDYKSSKIIIKYLKRNDFPKESIVEMKNKISLLKQKIKIFHSKVDNLVNN